MDDIEKLLLDCVITIASDDYESFEIILDQTRHLAGLKGISVTEGQMAKIIEQAIADDLVEAFALSPCAPHAKKVIYSADQVQELWFYVTPKGKAAAKSVFELSGEN